MSSSARSSSASPAARWDVLRERVLAPAGMTATRSSGPRAVIRPRARVGEADLWVSITLERDGAIAQIYWW